MELAWVFSIAVIKKLRKFSTKNDTNILSYTFLDQMSYNLG